MIRRFVVASVIYGLIGAALWFADVALASAAGDETGWEFGVGVGIKPDYEGSEDYELAPVARFKVNLEGGRFIEGGGNHGSGKAARVRANLLTNPNVTLGPVLQYRPARGHVKNDFIDGSPLGTHDAPIEGMPGVDAAVEAGGFLGLEWSGWFLESTAATEVSQGANSGTTVELTTGYGGEASRNLAYAVGVASTWADDDYMQTYFGVTGPAGTPGTQAAQSGLDPYNADGGFKDVGASLMLRWRGDDWERWSIQTVASYFRLIGDADDDSPIVDVGSTDQLFGGLMFVYSN